MTRVHQFHPVLSPGDAMSDHVFALRDRIRGWGHEAEAYAIEAKPGVEREVVPYRRLFRDVRPDDTLILHYSMGSEVFDQLVKLACRRVLVYHNVTPPGFFTGINAHAAAAARLGRRKLAELAPRIDLAIGVSDYNTRELDAVGFRPTATVPILIDWSRFDVAPDQTVLNAWSGPDSTGTKLLFVGRISPNKRQDELIRMLAYYRGCIDPAAQLLLVGAFRDQPQYDQRLHALVRALDLEAGVTFAGPVSQAELVAYYRCASVFVSLSEHEGFGIPLLEAMHHRVPVVALDRAAVGETVDGAGVLVQEKDLAAVAEVCALVVERDDLRAPLIAAGLRRVADFDADRVAERTRAVLGL
jgi:glycosyltransferase involved in cell wall biosynthesis